MEIALQLEILLRKAGYETWQSGPSFGSAIFFENPTVFGFANIFKSAEELVASWEQRQNGVLSRLTPALRGMGIKAWNMYSVLLSEADDPKLRRQVQQLEEDFSLTRKLARINIRTSDDIVYAVLPLLPIQANPILANAHFGERLNARVKDIPADVVHAFLGASKPDEISRLLGGSA